MNNQPLRRLPALLIALAILSIAPMASASAAVSHRAQIARNFEVLKLLPNQAASETQVATFVYRLVTFDPRGAIKYFRIGITKLGNSNGTFAQSFTRIEIGIAKILKKSGLPSATINRINRAIASIDGQNSTDNGPLVLYP